MTAKEQARVNQTLSKKKIDKIAPDEWLNDTVINAASTLLRKLAIENDIEVGGLYNVEFGVSANYPPALGNWLQITHNGINHWLLAAHGFGHNEDPLSVTIYDRLKKKGLNRHVVATCASLLFSIHPRKGFHNQQARY